MPPRKDIDRLIQAIYALAIEDWQSFRTLALERLCGYFGARGGAWLTISGTGVAGEFGEWPTDEGHTGDQLQSIPFLPDRREIALSPLPESLQAHAAVDGDSGIAVRYSHRGADLTSIVLLRFAALPAVESEGLRRAVGHMVEAGTLALRHFIQRDDWLHAMGRSNRGGAALVDAGGTVYAASGRFRDMLAAHEKTHELRHLPCPLPPDALGEQGAFSWGSLHFRASRHRRLHLLHVRAPLPLDGLSPREQEIARALGTGKTFKSVARQYGIALSTVANHASRIYRKLGVYRREDLVQLMRRPADEGPAR